MLTHLAEQAPVVLPAAQGLAGYLSQADGRMYEVKPRRPADIPPSRG